MSAVLFKNVNHIFNMYEKDLAFNNLQRLICHKTQLNNQQKSILKSTQFPNCWH